MKFTSGNILDFQADALVNTVNTMGIMGKGIAAAFKQSFPLASTAYMKAARAREIKIGKIFVSETGQITPKYILHFPTKEHWRYPSKISYIRAGLDDLVQVIRERKIKSVVIPPLGCGNGKLDWKEVKPLIEASLSPIAENVDITIIEPGLNPEPSKPTVGAGLTVKRALLLYLLKNYQVLGYSINLLVVQKTAYFLQRFGENLDLRFEKGTYGPYAHRLSHLLDHLNGTYVHFRSGEIKPSTLLTIDSHKYPEVEKYYEVNAADDQKERTKKVLDLINGFESPYGLELFATIDFIIQQTGVDSLEAIQNEISSWTARKKTIMKPRHIEVAYQRLKPFLYSDVQPQKID